MMKIFVIISFLIVGTIFSQNQYEIEKSGYLSEIRETRHGLVFSDNMGSGLYLLSGNDVEKIVESPNCGKFYSVDADGNLLGYKKIREDGSQTPAIYDLRSGKITEVWEKGDKCGQVSFAKGGIYAFMVDKQLVVIRDEKAEIYDIGHYSNIAPVSADLNYVVFNDLSDNLWLYNLLKGDKRKITDKGGYFYPEWAENGKRFVYRSFTGDLLVYDIETGSTYELGTGDNPTWNSDGEYLIFDRKVITDMTLEGSDIYISKFDGTELKRLTAGKENLMEPTFSIDGKRVIYHNYEGGEIIERGFDFNDFRLPDQEKRIKPKLSIKFYEIQGNGEEVKTLDIPYVNQVYDTPDWHNGHSSCGATAGVMTLAYFNILPKWEGYCAKPSPHYNNWGRYVAEKYRYGERAYELQVDDPNGNPAWGGHGYLWRGGSPRTKMSGWLANHKVSVEFKEPPTYEEVISEINSNYPYTLCVMLTTAGHIIVGHGIHQERTLIFNDPYGNKNTGYFNWSGKNVKYDWPSYNNGFQNLTGVPWGIKTRFGIFGAADSVVDDGQLDKGFYLHTKYPATMFRWYDRNVGYANNHMWYAFSNGTTHTDTCYATWKPKLSRDGAYEVLVYIPFSNATKVIYKVFHKDGMDTVVINQKIYASQWVSLGKFNFLATGNGYVRLGDATGVAGQQMIFDAMKFNYMGDFISGTEEVEGVAGGFKLYENYPNPFNPSTMIQYELPERGMVRLRIYDILGKEVAELVNNEQEAGRYEIEFDGRGLVSGMYICELSIGKQIRTIKMSLVK